MVATGCAAQALGLGQTALVAHEKALGPNHAWSKDSARVTADALDALGRADEATAMRARYGLKPAGGVTHPRFCRRLNEGLAPATLDGTSGTQQRALHRSALLFNPDLERECRFRPRL
jgi:hypothetical protein